eukprot:65755_1
MSLDINIQDMNSRDSVKADSIDQNAQILENVINNHMILCRFKASYTVFYVLMGIMGLCNAICAIPTDRNSIQWIWVINTVISVISVCIGVYGLHANKYVYFILFTLIHAVTTCISAGHLLMNAVSRNASVHIRFTIVCVCVIVFEFFVMTEVIRASIEIRKRTTEAYLSEETIPNNAGVNQQTSHVIKTIDELV